jgi:hypothetical protein
MSALPPGFKPEFASWLFFNTLARGRVFLPEETPSAKTTSSSGLDKWTFTLCSCPKEDTIGCSVVVTCQLKRCLPLLVSQVRIGSMSHQDGQASHGRKLIGGKQHQSRVPLRGARIHVHAVCQQQVHHIRIVLLNAFQKGCVA